MKIKDIIRRIFGRRSKTNDVPGDLYVKLGPTKTIKIKATIKTIKKS